MNLEAKASRFFYAHLTSKTPGMGFYHPRLAFRTPCALDWTPRDTSPRPNLAFATSILGFGTPILDCRTSPTGLLTPNEDDGTCRAGYFEALMGIFSEITGNRKGLFLENFTFEVYRYFLSLCREFII